MIDETKVIFSDQAFTGTAVRKTDNKIDPMIGVVVSGSELHFVYPFRGTERAREFCKDLLDICDRLDKEEAEDDGR